jgi:hypothetical protein
MANELVVNVGVTAGGVPLVATSQRASGSSMLVIRESIAGAATDVAVACAIDKDALEGLVMVSDRDVLVETNSGSAADDSFALKAGVPLVWTKNGTPTAVPLSEDVVALYVTNAGSQAATLDVVAVTDATP